MPMILIYHIMAWSMMNHQTAPSRRTGVFRGAPKPILATRQPSFLTWQRTGGFVLTVITMIKMQYDSTRKGVICGARWFQGYPALIIIQYFLLINYIMERGVVSTVPPTSYYDSTVVCWHQAWHQPKIYADLRVHTHV